MLRIERRNQIGRLALLLALAVVVLIAMLIARGLGGQGVALDAASGVVAGAVSDDVGAQSPETGESSAAVVAP